MILGLDISTSITGYTVLDDDGKIVVCNHIDLRKEKNFFRKIQIVNTRLELITDEYEIEKVYIEQSLQSFRSGFSSAQTLSLLSKINGIVSWLCYNLFYGDPLFIGATSARKECGIKVTRGRKAKEVVLEFVLDNVPDFDIEYTKFGNPRPGYGDRADSYIIAKAGWLRERQETKNTD